MGLHATTAYNKKARCKSRLNDLLSRAKSFKVTHDWILKERNTIFESTDWKPLPRCDKEYLRGYFEAQNEELWNYHLEWRMWVNFTDDQLVYFRMIRFDNHLCFVAGRETVDGYPGPYHPHLLTGNQIRYLQGHCGDTFKDIYSRINLDKSVHTWRG